MNRFLKILLISIVSSCFLNPLAAQPNLNGSVNLTIKVTGFKQTTGKVKIALYNNQNGFLLPEKVYKTFDVKVNQSKIQHTVKLPKGNYAVALYHDGNNNGICDKNFLGIPLEGYGFSNNIRPFLSAPSYQSTKLELKKDLAIEIALLR